MHQNNKNPDEILQQFYILYDEIDTIIDPIKSNFNNIIKYDNIINYIVNVKQILYNIYIKELIKVLSNNEKYKYLINEIK